jgi:molybdopterin-guanine dinucleotide biosynthesis protein A
MKLEQLASMGLEQIEKNLLQAEQNGQARVWASPDEFLALLIALYTSANAASQALDGINHGLAKINATLERIEGHAADLPK